MLRTLIFPRYSLGKISTSLRMTYRFLILFYSFVLKNANFSKTVAKHYILMYNNSIKKKADSTVYVLRIRLSIFKKGFFVIL